MKNYYCQTLSMLLVVLALAACSKDDDAGGGKEVEVNGQKMIVLDSLNINLIRGDSVFIQNLPSENLPGEGDIICTSVSLKTPYGLLKRVNRVTNNGDNITLLETEMVPIDQAFQKLNIDTTLDVSQYVREIITPEGQELEFKCVRSVNARSKEVESYIEFKISFEEDKSPVYGEIKLYMDYKFLIDIDNFTLKRFETILHPKCVFSGGAKLPKEKEFRKSLGKIELRPIPIGFLVVVPTLEPTLVCGIEGGASIDVGVTYTLAGQYGMVYNNDGWNNICITDPVNSTIDPLKEISLNGKLYIGMDMDVAVGLYFSKPMLGVSLKPRINFAGNISFDPQVYFRNPEVSLSLEIKGNMFSEVSVLSTKIIDYKSPELSVLIPLWTRHVFPLFKDLKIETGNNNLSLDYDLEESPCFNMKHGYSLFKNSILNSEYLFDENVGFNTVAGTHYNIDKFINLPGGTYEICPVYILFGKRFYGYRQEVVIETPVLQWMDRNMGYFTFYGAQSACPDGYRLPTSGELGELLQNPMTRTGGWNENSPGALHIQLGDGKELQLQAGPGGSSGVYWSSTPGGVAGYYLNFTATDASVTRPIFLGDQSMGGAVRCVKK